MISARPNVELSHRTPRRAVDARWFIDRRLQGCVCVVDDVQALLDLSCEAAAQEVIEAVGERAVEALDSAAFEAEIRLGPDMASLRLRRLSALRVRFNVSTLLERHRAAASAILNRIERQIRADADIAQGAADAGPQSGE